MSITSSGPFCDVCGNLIMPFGDEMVNRFDVWGLVGLIADNACTAKVKEAHAKRDWGVLPEGPLKKIWQEQTARESKP